MIARRGGPGSSRSARRCAQPSLQSATSAVRCLHSRREGRHACVQRHASRMGPSTRADAASSRWRAASTCLREGSTRVIAESSCARVKSDVCKPLTRRPGLTSLHAPVQGRTADVQSRTTRMLARTPRVRGRTGRLRGHHGRVRGHPEARECSSRACARSKDARDGSSAALPAARLSAARDGRGASQHVEPARLQFLHQGSTCSASQVSRL